MSIRRRDFLKQGIAAAATAGVAHSVSASSSTVVGAERTPLSSAHMIWSADAVPVPLRAGGVAERIASSANGQTADSAPDFHCVFAREIMLPAVPQLAILHLFIFTRYRLYVNGIYVGRGPCRYQNQRPEYDSRDLRQHLQPGRNVLVVLVHRDAPTGRIMLHQPGFIAALELLSEGKRRVVATDASWRSMPELSFGSRATAWASIEEHLDARKTADWTSPEPGLPGWQPALVLSGSEALRFFPRTTPLQLEQARQWSSESPALPIELTTGSEIAFSLPEIVQAFHVLEMDAEQGTTLDILYELPDGESSGRCTYIARAGIQQWMGGDTFALLRLRVRVTAGKLRLMRAAAYEVRYPFERAASFTCSDPFFNRLWTICARTLEVLSEDAYVDCADRERVEWTDVSPPAFECTRVTMRGRDATGRPVWGDARLLGGLLRRIALTQQPDGQLKAHSCSDRFDIHAIMEDRTCDWVVLLREYLESCGDAGLVREVWPTLLRLLDWYSQRSTARGLVLAREWEVWDNPLRYQVCEGAGLNAMVYRALVDATALARRLGKQADAVRLTRRTQHLRDSYNRLLWNDTEGAFDGALFGPGSKVHPRKDFSGSAIADGRYPPTAQANLFALYSGIVAPERVSSVRKWLLNHLEQVREPMSHYYLFRMLYAMDDPAHDASVLSLMRTNWKNQVDSVWQTSWEELEKGGGSKVHCYGMHPGYFLTAFVLGARREGSVDERTILIEPRFSGLAWAKGICVTEFGPVAMEWTIDAAGLPEIVCDVPAGTKARLRLSAVDAKGALEIDGKIAPTRYTGGRLEASLRPGKHIIRLRAPAGA